MLVTRSRALRLITVALAASALRPPAAALGSPSVIRINPSSGAQTVLASGAPWTKLAGVAVDASGTIYVADGKGIFSLASPGFATTPVVSGTGYAAGLVSAGPALYAFRSSAVQSIDTTAPFAQRLLASGGVYAESTVGPVFGALSGSTLYTTTYASCGSVEGGPGQVVAVDTATGQQTWVKNFSCAGLQGIALAPDGTLLIAESGLGKAAAKIVRLNPANGSVSTVASGGSLKDPRGIALTTPDRLVVADATSGVLAVSTTNGKQSTLASGPGLRGATGVALDASGNVYVTAAGSRPVLKVSAANQRFSAAGFRFKASCKPRCDVRYEVEVQAKGVYPFSQSGEVTGIGSTRTLTARLPKSVNRDIARALDRHRTVRMKLTAHPQDVDGERIGITTSLRVRLTR